MNYNWQKLLSQFDEKYLADERIMQEFFHSSDIPLSLFNEPATEIEINDLERKISIELPPSYKEFLKTTNGFKIINQLFGNLFPANLVQPLISFDPHLVEIWSAMDFEVTDEMYFDYSETQRTEWLRGKYFNDCIAISDWFDGGIILLNPNVKMGEEFEAWAFANWYPGATRYKSFWDLMNEEFKSYSELKDVE